MRAIWIIAIGTSTGIVYGLLFGLVAGALCPAYFTIDSVPESIGGLPAPLSGALVFLRLSWWIGMLVGVSIAVSARCRRVARLDVTPYVRPSLMFVAFTGVVAAGTGLVTYAAARRGIVSVPHEIASRLTLHDAQVYVGIHSAQLVSIFLPWIGLAMVLSTWICLRRGRVDQNASKDDRRRLPH